MSPSCLSCLLSTCPFLSEDSKFPEGMGCFLFPSVLIFPEDCLLHCTWAVVEVNEGGAKCWTYLKSLMITSPRRLPVSRIWVLPWLSQFFLETCFLNVRQSIEPSLVLSPCQVEDWDQVLKHGASVTISCTWLPDGRWFSFHCLDRWLMAPCCPLWLDFSQASKWALAFPVPSGFLRCP